MLRSLVALALAAILVASGSAEEVSLPGTSLVFESPEGFTPLTEKEIATKFPTARAPKYVMGNARRSTTVAYDFKSDTFPADRIAEVKESFEKLFERLVPGLEWKDRKIIELAGKKWIYLEMKSNAVDTDIHNIMLASPHEKGMILFNFNSTREEFPKVEKALRTSLNSIKFK